MATLKFRFPSRIKQKVNEFSTNTGLRSSLSALRRGFYVAPTSPALRDTTLDRDKVRSLYYNTDTNFHQGSFIAKGIVDSAADYIGIPTFSVQDPSVDLIMNKWVEDWTQALWEMYRNSLRDCDTWVRLRKAPLGPLLADDERDYVTLEIIDTDRVTPYYDPETNELIRVEILTTVYVEDKPFDPFQIYAQGLHTHGREHELVEIITPSQYMYYDATTAQLWESLTTDNQWGFVPLLQVFNDYDSALHGGVCELETAYPFFHAIHELIIQTRQAHKYHANPKVKFKLKDVMSFISNNWPSSIVDGQFTGKVSWRDNEVFFMEDDEDADFVQATLATGDTTDLLDFLIECVCMASETPAEMLLKAGVEGSKTTEVHQRFKKKIARKRGNYEAYLRMIMRMALKIGLNAPKRTTITWPYIEVEDMLTEAQALNQVVTAAEVANRAKVISRSTYRSTIKQFFPAMQDDANEDKNIQTETAADNKEQVDLQKQMTEATGGGNSNGNGGGPNSASNRRNRVRAALPMDAAPPQPGE